jgi:sugar-specific transcriptional regulator TrmB/predicted hydrocarbon binding protein
MALSFYERLTKLKEFGLTEYQARAYLALLELNISTANQIPAVSRVPRTKIYGIMRQLHDKGLVQIIPETPLKYKAVQFNQYLERRVGQLKEEAEELKRSMPKLTEAFRVKPHEPDEQGKFEMFYGRRNVRDKLRDMYSHAKKHLISIGNETSPGRIIRTSISIIEDIAEAGIKIEYAFPVKTENLERVERLSKYATIKHIDRRPSMHFIVVDKKECMLVHRIPNDEDPVRGEDIAIWSNDNAIVSSILEFARDIFDEGVNYQAYNQFRPPLTNITNWIRSLDINYKAFLNTLGHELGNELVKKCKAKKIEPLVKEMQEFWVEHNLGTLKIIKKKPVQIEMENNMDCKKEPQIAKAICGFTKSLLSTIFEEKLGVKCTVKEVDCKPNRQTFCRFQVDVIKK